MWMRGGGWCVEGGGGQRGLFSTAASADRPRKEAFPQPHQCVRGHVSAAASFSSVKLNYESFIHYKRGFPDFTRVSKCPHMSPGFVCFF